MLIASHLRYLIKFMSLVHTYFYIVVDTQRGSRTLKLREDVSVVNLYPPNDIYIYIYIYIYMSYRTANLQMLHFIYLFNKYTY